MKKFTIVLAITLFSLLGNVNAQVAVNPTCKYRFQKPVIKKYLIFYRLTISTLKFCSKTLEFINS